jgi:hypothetical protein
MEENPKKKWLQEQAEDVFKQSFCSELYGFCLFTLEYFDPARPYRFQPDEDGDAVWLLQHNYQRQEYEVLRVEEASKLPPSRPVLPGVCQFWHDVPIDIIYLLGNDITVEDIEKKIVKGGQTFAQGINQYFVNVLIEASVDSKLPAQKNMGLDDILAQVSDRLSGAGFSADRLLFPKAFQHRLVQRDILIPDDEIQNNHYVGKTKTGLYAFWSGELPEGTVLIFDSTAGIVIRSNLHFYENKSTRPLSRSVGGAIYLNPIIKNTQSVIAIESVDQMIDFTQPQATSVPVTPANELTTIYDVALSFAGEDREYVEQVAEILKKRHIRVFYDRFEEIHLWGKDLYVHLDTVYRLKARYCVMFISKHYASKLWTNHERKSAQARAFQENKEYLLPARFDNTDIPGVRPTVGYVDLRITSPSQLAEKIIAKLEQNSPSDTRSSQPAGRLRESSTPYSASPQDGRPPSASAASLMREVERIQKVIDHNLQLKLDDTPQHAKEMPVTAFETAFHGERRLDVSEELEQAVDDYLDFAASINLLVARYENQISSGRGTEPRQLGVPGSSDSSYTIQLIQEEISKQQCIENLKQHIEELERSQQRTEESMPEATRETPATFQSTPPERLPTFEHFTTHIDSVTGPVHTGRGDIIYSASLQDGPPPAVKRSRSKPLAITLFILSIVIAIVTNVASDKLPEAWEPHLWLAWPLLVVLVIISILLVLKSKGPIDSA